MSAVATPTSTGVEHLGTILGVWAHPDDEAYLSGGLMALARRGGQRVVVVTATAGEEGSGDPAVRGTRAFAHRRRDELAEALACLDVAEHHVVGLPDGGLADLPAEAGPELIGSWIDEVRPDTIVTFGPDGITGHADHLAIHRWATTAWAARGRRATLLQATVTPSFHRRWGHVNRQIELWQGAIPCTPHDRLALEVVVPADVLDQKVDALRAHASQTDGLVELMGVDAYRRWWDVEAFVEAV